MDEELRWVDVVAQRRLLADGEVSARELVEAAIERIGVLNPRLNAVIHSQFDAAVAGAGIPMLLKDSLCTEAGQPHHCGLRAARERGYVAPADSELVVRYKRSGFAILGRTNIPELAAAVTTEPLAYGPTRNPWDVRFSPGGSSGGSAAAVASGMVAAASGNDMGGSIRIPASNCGIIGLKPTRGRTTLAPDFGEFWGPFTHQHVLARTLRDCAAILDDTAGPAPGDPYSAPPGERAWALEVDAPPGRLRVGYRTAIPGGGEPHADVREAVMSTVELLDSLGRHVTQADVHALDDEQHRESSGYLFAGAVARDVVRWSRLLRTDISGELEVPNAYMASIGAKLSAPDWLGHLEVLQAWTRRMARIWDGLDVLVLPVLPEPPARIGESTPGDAGRLTVFTVPFNITGEPAISLPLHLSSEGLPIGVQIVAPTGREDRIFQLSGQLERARPWAAIKPPSP